MKQFYETRRGQDFFTHQFPKMIDELTRIANIMEKQSQSIINIPMEVPDDFLEQLFFGNLEPDAEITGNDLDNYLKKSINLQNELRRQLTKEQWELLEKLLHVYEKRSARETALGFDTGFRMAMQMIIAGMRPLESTAKGEKHGEKN